MTYAKKYSEMMQKKAAESKAVNEAFHAMVSENADGYLKQASQITSEYIRVEMQEDSVFDKIVPPVSVGNEDLDKQVDTPNPVIVQDMEPKSGGAVSLPFGNLPISRYMRAPRFRVDFERMSSTRYYIDVNHLRTYDMDIRQVLSDKSVKDISTEKDSKFFSTVNRTDVIGTQLYATLSGTGNGAVVGTPTNLASGLSRNYIYTDASYISRDTIVEISKVLPATDARLEAQTMVVNHLTVKDFNKWDRNEAGGDLSQELLLNGWAERTVQGIRVIVTIKRELVPNGVFYLFAEPKYLGVNYVLEDLTMWIKKEAFNLEFFSYMTAGGTIANIKGCARVEVRRS